MTTPETKEPTTAAFKTTWFHRLHGAPFVKQERKDAGSPLILRNWHLVVDCSNHDAVDLAATKVEAVPLIGVPFHEAVESMLRLVPLCATNTDSVVQRQQIVCSLGADLARALHRVGNASFEFRSFDGEHIRVTGKPATSAGAGGCHMSLSTRLIVDFSICPLGRWDLVSHCYVRNPRDKREVAGVQALTKEYAATCHNSRITKACFAVLLAHFLILATTGVDESKDSAQDWCTPVDIGWDELLAKMVVMNKRFQAAVKGSSVLGAKAVDLITLILTDPSGDKAWQTRLEDFVTALSA